MKQGRKVRAWAWVWKSPWSGSYLAIHQGLDRPLYFPSGLAGSLEDWKWAEIREVASRRTPREGGKSGTR